MAADIMPISPTVLRWARERAGFSLDALAGDFTKLAEWEAGDMAPTYPQLEQLADKLKLPISVFFFPEPPDVPAPEQTFRTLGAQQLQGIPPRIRLLLRKARALQLGLEELNNGASPSVRLITDDLRFSPSENINEIASAVREYLGVSIEEQLSWNNIDHALKEWRSTLQSVGVYVFKDQFRQPEYSGFCLYDPIFPIIYVNNTNSKSRQIFTLFHELAHLLFHTSGIDEKNDRYLEQLRDDNLRIEVICNQFASSFLIPDEIFESVNGSLVPDEDAAEELARRFSVSREAIFRKFLDRGEISAYQYEQAANQWSAQLQKGSGGNPYNNTIAYLGRDYITLAFRKFHQNQISYADLSDYLNTKQKHLATLEEYVARGKN
ncbi:helix-turn-helix domain-containing protein [Pararhizobium mangrovi]|uniref:ImmA/IrrE family metallo-endopeptidase n=1 Tax=Pararhizobium mangrovi TaxID=2590452 RepID=A0A506TYL2_9HYPH|nr:XRE family transcriptional regulator [Pararhizobium mangrovi]TPW25814.1 ImmA/IrrE family metallo-endopeptidase [Pararhizobium mangrovi]